MLLCPKAWCIKWSGVKAPLSLYFNPLDFKYVRRISKSDLLVKHEIHHLRHMTHLREPLLSTDFIIVIVVDSKCQG
jgi:hypothetical protein